LRHLLKAARLKRSTFYHHRALAQVEDKYAQVKQAIGAIYHRHKGRYGYRRITSALRQQGNVINHKAVQRLMGELGLKSLVRPKKYKSYRGDEGAVAPDLLKRDFEAAAPNQKWTTDVTEFNVGGKKVFLSPVMDLFNREIICFTVSNRPDFTLVKSMVMQALGKLKRDESPVLHSDQGWQYRMSSYQNILTKRNVAQSMSRKGNCFDNAAMESFFGVLKTEFFYLEKFTCVEHFKKALRKYIRYYNRERCKLSLGGLSPVQYRTQPRQPELKPSN
jgi:putative transposase